MSKSATTRTIESLHAQLKTEKADHARTRRELQAEIERVWRLVPSWKIHLMGAFPPLKKLLVVLGEAAELQDPSSGAPTSDTMRSEVTELTPTERAVLTHRQHRATVAEMNRQLDWFTHKMSKLIPGPELEYNPPSGECPECGRYIFQVGAGRERIFCSKPCRQKASRRNATKEPSPISVNGD